MDTRKNVWTIVVGVVLLTGCAGSEREADGAASGTVTGVYGEPVPGILMSRDLRGHRSADEPVWVDVRMARPLGDGRDHVLARIDDHDILAGDRVDLTLAPGRNPGGSVQDTGPSVVWGLPFQRAGEATRAPERRIAQAHRRFRVEVEPVAVPDAR